MIVIKEIKRTCYACPSQWEGKTEDNRLVYIRYRWGSLDVWISEPNETDIGRVFYGRTTFEKQLGDDLDGYLSFEDLKTVTEGHISWKL